MLPEPCLTTIDAPLWTITETAPVAEKTFRCRLVTPAASFLDEPVTYASIPAWDGMMGILAGRAPIVAKLGIGELRLRFPGASAKGGERAYFVDGGFIQMTGDTLTILAESAAAAESIDRGAAEAELKAAESATIPADAADSGAARDKIAHARTAARAKLRVATGAEKGI